MKCSKCNTETDGNYCSNCGTKLYSTKARLLGFRSNKTWKKIVSIVYLVFVSLAFIVSLTDERQGKITLYDFWIDKIFSIIMCLILACPYIFWSNSNFRDRLPLFKKHSKIASFGGMTIILSVMLILVGVVNLMHSTEYQADMKNHAFIVTDSIEATCVTDGKISYYCDYCARTEDEIIPAKGHQMFEVSRVEATCVDDGSVVSKCSECGEEETSQISALGHHMVEISRVEPTVDKEGEVVSKCDVCGHTVTERIDKIHKSDDSDDAIDDNKTAGNQTSTPNVDEEIDDKYQAVFQGVISDKLLIKNICNAMQAVEISPDEISSLEQVADWVAGERYNFTYKSLGLTIYTNMNSSVNSITLGVDTHIYLQGYEPYQIDDYIISSYIRSNLISKAKERVKSQLNYPATADFPWLDWSVGRDHELYSVSSSVEAKNAFGVEDELPFKLIYQVKNDTYKLIYFIIDGAVIVNNLSTIEKPERNEVEIDQPSGDQGNTTDIILTYGQKGLYGKEVTLDGEKYINFHVPQGTYTIKNNVKWCVVYIAKDEYYKNSDGYMENEIVQTIILDSQDKTATITIGEGQHIEITLNGSITLIPQ